MSSTASHTSTAAISASPSQRAANRFGLDYRAEARRLGPPAVPIVDVHSHINGPAAAAIYKEAATLYGVRQVYSMTHLEGVPAMRDLFGDAMRFIAVPNWGAADRLAAFTTDWLDRIEQYAALGCRVCKFWTAPRARDIEAQLGRPGLFGLDNEWRRRAMALARDAGMMFMAHVGDPDTWFATKYADASKYGTKREQYEPLERALNDFADVPWIAAHMGGYPEDLAFLDDLLSRHGNLYLDTSATKWMVRELSRHSREELIAFLRKWSGRVLFGSDIVTTDEHLREGPKGPGMGDLATNPAEAFDLYASRYYALRTMWDTDYEGESPIADPDLAMVEPERYGPDAAPPLRGRALPSDLLRVLYHDAAANLLDRWHATH